MSCVFVYRSICSNLQLNLGVSGKILYAYSVQVQEQKTWLEKLCQKAAMRIVNISGNEYSGCWENFVNVEVEN